MRKSGSPTGKRASRIKKLTPKPRRTLVEAISDLSFEGSGIDTRTLQELRAIFLHCDEQDKSQLTLSQMIKALSMVGIHAEREFIETFQDNIEADATQEERLYDFTTFANIAASELTSPTRMVGVADLVDLFQLFDEESSRQLTPPVLKHLLCEVEAPAQLSEQEFTAFMKGLQENSMAYLNKQDKESSIAPIDYVQLSHELMFPRRLAAKDVDSDFDL